MCAIIIIYYYIYTLYHAYNINLVFLVYIITWLLDVNLDVNICNILLYCIINTVEPPNKGQLGTRHFVPCSEVGLSWRPTNFFT